jgi:hypothetical protein
MLNQVDLEETGRFLGVLKPCKDGDSAVEKADGLGARSAADFHLLFWFSQEAVDSARADFFEFGSDGVGHAVFFSEHDEVKVLPEEWREEFSAGQLKFFQSDSSVAATSAL